MKCCTTVFQGVLWRVFGIMARVGAYLKFSCFKLFHTRSFTILFADWIFQFLRNYLLNNYFRNIFQHLDFILVKKAHFITSLNF